MATGRHLIRAAALALALLAAGPALAAPSMCRTNLHGTTFCTDGTVLRTNLHGTSFANDRRVWRTTLTGTRLASDGSVRRGAAPLGHADGRTWDGDFLRPDMRPVGGVGCDTALDPAPFC